MGAEKERIREHGIDMASRDREDLQLFEEHVREPEDGVGDDGEVVNAPALETIYGLRVLRWGGMFHLYYDLEH